MSFAATDASHTPYLLKHYNFKAVRGHVLSTGKSALSAVKAELALVRQLRHPSLLQVHHIEECQDSAVVIYEQATHELLQAAVPLSARAAWRAFRSLVEGLYFLHTSGSIAHGAVRPQSLCFTPAGDLRLTGLAHHVPIVNGCDAVYGESPVAAPEASKKWYRGLPLDAWGCGLCLYYLHTGRELVSPAEIFKAGLSLGVVELLEELLNSDPKERLTVAELTVHDWVTSRGRYPLCKK